MKISAVVLTNNEEKNIDACLKSLQWCDEIIVIDDYSNDQTVRMAKKLGAIVSEHALNNDFAQQRNFGLKKAKGEWILFVDADERISEASAAEIESRIRSQESRVNGYYVHREDSMWGRVLGHGETGDIQLLRLGRRDAGEWEGKVHENWKIKGATCILINPLLHYPHPTISEFLSEINFYTTLRAEELFQQKVPVSVGRIVAYPTGKFIINYFLKRGFLDGTAGIVSALLMSFHSFLVRGKLWQLWQKK